MAGGDHSKHLFSGGNFARQTLARRQAGGGLPAPIITIMSCGKFHIYREIISTCQEGCCQEGVYGGKYIYEWLEVILL